MLLNYVCMQTKKEDKTDEFLPREPRIPENIVGTKNTNNCKTRISSTSCRTRPWIVHTIRDKNFDILGQVRMLKCRSCRTQKEKNNIHMDKMCRPCRHIAKHGSFHIPRCAVTAGVLKTLPLYAMRADSPERHVSSVLASGLR